MSSMSQQKQKMRKFTTAFTNLKEKNDGHVERVRRKVSMSQVTDTLGAEQITTPWTACRMVEMDIIESCKKMIRKVNSHKRNPSYELCGRPDNPDIRHEVLPKESFLYYVGKKGMILATDGYASCENRSQLDLLKDKPTNPGKIQFPDGGYAEDILKRQERWIKAQELDGYLCY